MGEGDGSGVAFADTVAAHDAACIVYFVVLRVDAGCFAASGAESAADAFVGVDVEFEPRETGEEAQKGADGADEIGRAHV